MAVCKSVSIFYQNIAVFFSEIIQKTSKDLRHKKIRSLEMTAYIKITPKTPMYQHFIKQNKVCTYLHTFKFICTNFYTNLSPRPNTPRAYNSISSLNETHDTTKTRNEVN